MRVRRVGVVREIKAQENRVALTPAGVHELVEAGHEVLVEAGAGNGSRIDDAAYASAGARLVPRAETVWSDCELVLKVKEPLEPEWPRMRAGQTLFTYFHLAASRALTEAMLRTGSFCFAYETLEVDGRLPLLTPMSEVAGRMAVQAGAQWLEASRGGSGILLGGVPGVARAHVLVLGAGVVGTQAARMACGLGADVTVMDKSLERLRELDDIMPKNCRTLCSSPLSLRAELPKTDLLIGAVLIPGAQAPKLVRRADLALMKPGSVIVDVAVDQGGCVETARPTTHADPVYVVDGILHYCVANMPGAVPRTSTYALNNATLPYTLELARKGPIEAIRTSRALRSAANVVGGRITYNAVAQAFDMEYVPAEDAVAAAV